MRSNQTRFETQVAKITKSAFRCCRSMKPVSSSLAAARSLSSLQVRLCCHTFVLIVALTAIADHTAAQTNGDIISITPLTSGVESSFRGLAVRNSREAWIAGSNGVVIRTTDSGHTWHRITVPDADDLDFRDVELLPDGTALLMSVGEGNASRLLRSTDEGKNMARRTDQLGSERIL